MKTSALSASGAIYLATTCIAATTATITIDVGKPGIEISPIINGMMTEEINHAFDGGLYAELIQNRSFLDDPNKPIHWTILGDPTSPRLSVDKIEPMNPAHPLSLRIDLNGGKPIEVANSGYWGIPTRPNMVYHASFYARATEPLKGPMRVAIKSVDGASTFAEAELRGEPGKDWKKFNVDLKTSVDAPNSSDNVFAVSIPGETSGSLFLTMVSLFPPTFEGRLNGLRPDLMKLMQAMRPSFLRLPGGNYVEGYDFPNRFEWKKMIGPVDDRSGHNGCWSYRSSDGFGMPEFMTWCEQLKMEPVLGIFAGYTLDGKYVAAGPALQPFVDEALDEIEYFTGGPDTAWGKQRVEDGHAQPLKLRYVEVGNEDQFDRAHTYEGRFAQFFDAIKAKHPDLQIIATAPVRSRKADVIDDHYYRSAREMMYDNNHYDNADRHGPKIFVGEWASKEGEPTPTLNAALGDAAWLMGLERNSDLVIMQAYAPLLVNVNEHAWQWGTNLIGFNATQAFGSPSYWVQVMFAQNQGDRVLPTKLVINAPERTVSQTPEHGAVGVGTYRTAATYSAISLTDADGKSLLDEEQIRDSKNWKLHRGNWKVEGGSVSQSTSETENPLATIGNADWKNYTLHLKARKDAGSEGFLILFHVADAANQVWWNIGGSGNTINTFEITNEGSRRYLGPNTPYQVETGRTYDLAVEVNGTHYKAFIDGKLALEEDFKPVPMRPPVFADSTFLQSTGEVILKMVNASGDVVESTIELKGASKIGPTGTQHILTSDSARDQNSIEAPEKVIPKTSQFAGVASRFSYSLPAYSITVLRFPAKP